MLNLYVRRGTGISRNNAIKPAVRPVTDEKDEKRVILPRKQSCHIYDSVFLVTIVNTPTKDYKCFAFLIKLYILEDV